MNSLILVDTAVPTLTITLNRPQRHNSLIPEMLRQLLEALQTAKANPEIRAVVLQANGRSFSTGGDVKAFYLQRTNLETYATEIVGLLNQVILRLVTLPVPVITAVHGLVTGGSLGFLLGSDIVLMAPETTIQPWYPVVGFSPDGGWTAVLPQVIGRQRTADLLLTNGVMTAETAVAWGIASRLVPAAAIRAEAQKAAQIVSGMRPGSLARTKQLLFSDNELAARLDAERTHFVAQILTPEAAAGMAAFLKREV